ncbi:MAG: hypothetical protein NZ519_11375 [Bacteroidia bacterium]|nr:hypothetical protein [Bacteroidia bacterium]MDW8302357.1 hypothetical protein [Bacteroidia bacterium]
MSESANYIRTGFNPVSHGFDFGNGFLNTVIDLPIPKNVPEVILKWVQKQGAEIVTKDDGKRYLQVHARGRCGGMAFAALDYFYSRKPIPKCSKSELTEEGVPYDDHPLAKYIQKRLFDSFFKESAFRFVSWTLHEDEPNLLFKGVKYWTWQEQFPIIQASIHQGKPLPLGLVNARNLLDIGQKNHQVVVYGYAYEPQTEKLSLLLYDSNYPQVECVLTGTKKDKFFIQSNPGYSIDTWRGFFVQDYTAIVPPDF